MKFVISDKVPSPHSPASFEVVVHQMHGDTDGYTSLTVGPFFEDEMDILQDLIETLDRMKARYPHGRGGNDDYYDVEGFTRWFDPDDATDEDYARVAKVAERVVGFGIYWGSDITYEEGQPSMDRYVISYFDSELVEYAVTVEL